MLKSGKGHNTIKISPYEKITSHSTDSTTEHHTRAFYTPCQMTATTQVGCWLPTAGSLETKQVTARNSPPLPILRGVTLEN